MKNLTVSLPEVVLDRLRDLAAKRKTSLNKLVRETLTGLAGETDEAWEEQHSQLLARFAHYRSDAPWSREDVYADRI